MTRHMWVLMAWSPDYGAATTVIAVLGLDIHSDDTVELAVAWMPRQYHRGQIWRERLATTTQEDLLSQLRLWELSNIAPALRVVPVSAVDLHTAVMVQLDDLLATGSET